MKIIQPTQPIYFVDDSSENVPSPVTPPDCLEIIEGDGRQLAICLHDYDYDSRPTTIDETGEWFPAYWYHAGEQRIKNPKIITNLKGTTWLEWMRETLGDFNFAQKARRGDGTEDTNFDEVPVFLPDGSINPDKDRKQMVCFTGGAILEVIDEKRQGGKHFFLFDTMDFNSPPVKENGVWLYKGKQVTWDTDPQWFTSRVNRKVVKEHNRTFLSERGVAAWSDGGVDENGNLHGAKLKEWWPNCAKHIAALPSWEHREDTGDWIPNVKLFPSLPFNLRIYKNSVIVDGNLTPQDGGLEIIVDKYKVSGSKIYVHDKGTGSWFLAQEMLQRASVETGYYARDLDFRCYASPSGAYGLWLGDSAADRCYGIPDPGIWRKDMGL